MSSRPILGPALWALLLSASIGCSAPERRPPGEVPSADGDLRDPSAFDDIADPSARSQALFVEASRVLQHPRCTNCHPSGDAPLQGNNEPHDPPALRGPDNHGVVGMECTSCHQDRNLDHARIPGAPAWALAPVSMAWVGKSSGAICEQLKDKARNGDRSVDAIVEHSMHDALVGWAWAPGSGRATPPGNQARFGALMAAWASAGAVCPKEEEKP